MPCAFTAFIAHPTLPLIRHVSTYIDNRDFGQISANCYNLLFLDGTVTGILVSQIEVDFACIAACVPTLLKMIEELIALFFVHVLGRSYHGSRGESTRGENTSGSGTIKMSELRSKDRKPRSHGLYTDLGKDDQEGSMNSQEHIIKKGMDSPTAIKVQTDVNVTVSDSNGETDQRHP